MFKRITPQTIADWGERIYIRFLELTKRFTSTQIMALLAVIVGVLPDWAPACSSCCFTESKPD